MQQAFVNYAKEVSYDATKLEVWAISVLQVLTTMKTQQGEVLPKGLLGHQKGPKKA